MDMPDLQYRWFDLREATQMVQFPLSPAGVLASAVLPRGTMDTFLPGCSLAKVKHSPSSSEGPGLRESALHHPEKDGTHLPGSGRQLWHLCSPKGGILVRSGDIPLRPLPPHPHSTTTPWVQITPETMQSYRCQIRQMGIFSNRVSETLLTLAGPAELWGALETWDLQEKAQK